MKPPVSIIIPTWNNPQFLTPCILSIRATGVLGGLARLIIVNNGQQPIKDLVKGWPNTEVLEPGKNLGWERGLEFGLQHTDAPFVVFQNDDTHIPHANQFFYYSLLNVFNDNNVAAVGPATTIAAGWHSIFQPIPLMAKTEVSYLIFFTVMIRRAHYDLVGGIDTACPGGDDIDLSIRLRKAGKHLVVNPDAFLVHHAFKSGERLKGGPGIPGGWNSVEMQEKTNQYLIRKHGFKTFMETMRGLEPVRSTSVDSEGDLVREYVSEGKVLELGCGPTKTVEHAIGVDRVPRGEIIPHVAKISVADLVADVSEKIPVENHSYDVIIARHILEHCIDPIRTLKEWNRVLRIGGRLILAVPNENVTSGIPLNPEHVHAFTPESTMSLLRICGFRQVGGGDPMNGISFVGAYEKVADFALAEDKELELAGA